MIHLSNICKKYGNEENSFYALDHVSLEISNGEFVMIMGRSGCGKSTLLNIMGCIDSYDEGTYFLDNTDTQLLKHNELAKLRREKIGYIYQSYNLINELNCIENIELIQGYAGVPKKERQKNAERLLDKVELSDKAKKYPQQLSGGQQQRIAIARAISNHPKIILADEPTGNLDYSTGLQVMETLKSLNKDGITIIMVTHDNELISYASKVIHMHDGKFI